MLSAAEAYWERGLRYWRQVKEHLQRNELSKATELAWGSLVETFKALAATEGKELRTHREIREYARRVALSTGDEQLFHCFRDAEAAHSNFYQEFMDLTDTREVLAKIEQALVKVNRLLFPPDFPGKPSI